MSDYFPVGDFSRPFSEDRLVLGTVDAVENAQKGQILQRWGYCMEADEKIIRPQQLERLRFEGDELADQVVHALELKPGNDNLKKIEQYLSNTPEEQRNPSVVQFWEEMNAVPPFHTKSDKFDKELFTPQATMKANNRLAQPSVTEGQAVYWRYSTEIAGQPALTYALLRLAEGLASFPVTLLAYRRLLCVSHCQCTR